MCSILYRPGRFRAISVELGDPTHQTSRGWGKGLGAQPRRTRLRGAPAAAIGLAYGVRQAADLLLLVLPFALKALVEAVAAPPPPPPTPVSVTLGDLCRAGAAGKVTGIGRGYIVYCTLVNDIVQSILITLYILFQFPNKTYFLFENCNNSDVCDRS